MDLKFIHRGVGAVVTGESGYQVFGRTQLYQVGQVVGMQMELYVKTLTLSRCTEVFHGTANQHVLMHSRTSLRSLLKVTAELLKLLFI